MVDKYSKMDYSKVDCYSRRHGAGIAILESKDEQRRRILRGNQTV